MIARAEIVRCARTWIGTPFHHQGRLRGVGVDCAGLVIEVAREMEIADVDVLGYGRQPDPRAFRAALHEHLCEVAPQAALPGDVLSFAYIEEQHLAIASHVGVSGPAAMVHADQRSGGCVEVPLGHLWGRRLRGCWRFRSDLIA